MPTKPRRTKSLVHPNGPIRWFRSSPRAPSRGGCRGCAGISLIATARSSLPSKFFSVLLGFRLASKRQTSGLPPANQSVSSTTFLTSQLIDQLGSYKCPGQAIGHGLTHCTIVLTFPGARHVGAGNAIQHCCSSKIDAGTLPVTNPNTLYFVFCPKACSRASKTASCSPSAVPRSSGKQ